LRGEEQLGLGQEGVDGIDEDITGVLGEEFRSGVGIEEEGERGDVGFGMDVVEDAGGGIGLRGSEGGVEGEGMAVEIGGAEFVEVHKGEMSDPGAGEGFGGGGTDGTEAGNDDMGFGQPGEGICAEEQFEAFEGRGHGGESVAWRGCIAKEEGVGYAFTKLWCL